MTGEHKFYLGKYLPQVIDEIGGDIDFVILDTVHFLPGEVLDFPVMLPYLKNGAIVVLHDVIFNQFGKTLGYATTVLFSAICSEEKFLNSMATDKNLPFSYPNIGAFKIDKQTRKHIANVFLSLMVTWNYLPDEKQVEVYREFYKKYYPTELVTIFYETIRRNRDRIMFQKK